MSNIAEWPRCSNYTMQAADLVVLNCSLTCYTFEGVHLFYHSLSAIVILIIFSLLIQS